MPSIGETGGTWRDYFRPRVTKILDANAGKPPNELRGILREAWRGQCQHWPYRVWRDEVAAQCQARGLKGVVSPLAGERPGARRGHGAKADAPAVIDPRQESLF